MCPTFRGQVEPVVDSQAGSCAAMAVSIGTTRSRSGAKSRHTSGQPTQVLSQTAQPGGHGERRTFWAQLAAIVHQPLLQLVHHGNQAGVAHGRNRERDRARRGLLVELERERC
jgi:hypothetical protein